MAALAAESLGSWATWSSFAVLVLVLLALDLGMGKKRQADIQFREAVARVCFYVGLAAAFAGWIYYERGGQAAAMFATAYVIELSLSVDNIFLFLVIFGAFKVPQRHQHKVLFWGIVGAIAMRAAFIAAGLALIQSLAWMLYIFAAFLILTGLKLAFKKEDEADPRDNPLFRAMSKSPRFAPDDDSGNFFTVRNGVKCFTPLFLVLALVESSDFIFALDSLPAVLGVAIDAKTGVPDTFIIITSNVFAILGLRSMYFALSGVMTLFHYLHYALSAILVWVGIKMLISHTEWKVAPSTSFAVILSFLAAAVIASILFPKKAAPQGEAA